MYILDVAKDICDYLLTKPEIHKCKIYGSLANENFDEYSDIDITIDVSGVDNSIFLTKIPGILSEKYNIIFADYAPSLAPDVYVISVAISSENPFMVVDIKCTAQPHFTTLSRYDLISETDKYQHTLKLFVANLKHFLRGCECQNDIKKMYGRIFEAKYNYINEEEMLKATLSWLKENAAERFLGYLNSLSSYM